MLTALRYCLSSYDTKAAADALERLHRFIDLFRGVGRTHLGADTRLSLGHDGIREPDDIDALEQKLVGHSACQGGIAQHYRDNRMLARHQVEARRGHRRAKPLPIFTNAMTQ